MSTPAASSPEPIFIDFEGIDGSGKTTLSNRLADYLRECGIPVHHARDKGVFRSEISKAIRTLTRDPRFLRMSDVTEFLLYTARDTQMIDEYIRPKLQPGNIVFSDRYLHSAMTHSHHARGLDRDKVAAVLDIAARGLWPDLVVYCDVDPLTSRLRKKIQKINDRRPPSDFGRKGLMGIGFREEMRRGFLELADEDPEKWLVIDNANSTIEESLQRIFERVKVILERKGYKDVPNPRWAEPVDVSTHEQSDLETGVRGLLG
ncbi:MAG: dTMP kinase, partial [Planctomycetota bacterium]